MLATFGVILGIIGGLVLAAGIVYILMLAAEFNGH